MTKVNVELGLSLKMSTGGGYNYFRPQIGIHDIDIDGDVPDQIQRSLAVVHEAWAEVESSMAKLVTQADTVENESLLVELGRRMTDMEKHLTSLAGGSAKPW